MEECKAERGYEQHELLMIFLIQAPGHPICACGNTTDVEWAQSSASISQQYQQANRHARVRLLRQGDGFENGLRSLFLSDIPFA